MIDMIVEFVFEMILEFFGGIFDFFVDTNKRKKDEEAVGINKVVKVVGTVVGVQPAISFVNGRQINEGIVHLYKVPINDYTYTDARAYPQQVYGIGEQRQIKISLNSSRRQIIE